MMTQVKNRISRKTARRQGALARMRKNTGAKNAYATKDKEMATLEQRITTAPLGPVKTKKNRSDKAKAKGKTEGK